MPFWGKKTKLNGIDNQSVNFLQVYCKVPGRCLDMGCGDGKNMLFLEELGWEVIGIDICPYAINSAEKRYSESKLKLPKGMLLNEDVVEYQFPKKHFDLIVCYGLYHCLQDEEIGMIHEPMIESLRDGGLLAFATFNNNLPIPENHYTGDIILRQPNHIFEIVENRLETLKKEIGIITESHLPIVAEHKHALTWALFKKTK